jgi:Holliday junction resolvase RusA-like endonuclease
MTSASENVARETSPSRARIALTVIGQPQTAGSKRAFVLRRRDGSLVTRAGGSPVVNVTDDNAKSKDWKSAVAWSARQALPAGAELLRGALRVEFTFYRPRPKGHFRTNGELNRQGLEAPFPTTKPDVLKLARAAEDALTGVVWHDDAQIVEEVLRKVWGEPARLEIVIEALTHAVVAAPSPAQPALFEREPTAAEREEVPF